MKNNTILDDFKNNIINQFIGIITFGFGVTAFYSTLNTYINTNILTFSYIDAIFIFCSFIGCLFSSYILKEKINLKIKIFKSLDFVITILGFVLMFVPLILIFQKILNGNTSFEYVLIQNSIISFIVSIIIFLFKSIIKFFIKKTL